MGKVSVDLGGEPRGREGQEQDTEGGIHLGRMSATSSLS